MLLDALWCSQMLSRYFLDEGWIVKSVDRRLNGWLLVLSVLGRCLVQLGRSSGAGARGVDDRTFFAQLYKGDREIE